MTARELLLLDTNVVIHRRGGWNLSHNDTWIAATASVTNALLLTTDQDFARVDSAILRSVYIDPRTAK
jgi:predicted nuclease of predicted toxin-antitoxin system